MPASPNPEYLIGLVDIGSNGIRFSISDLSPPTARILPTIYQARCGVSLYNAQYTNGMKVPIPEDVIMEVLSALLRFERTCQDFGVPDHNVKIVATEATREAINSEEFRQRCEEQTGWKLEMLAKEEEGRVGAMGVASSFSSVEGLVMDLGGGSVQLTWMIADHGGVRMYEKGSVSLPYGAAALTRILAAAQNAGPEAIRNLQHEITGKFEQVIKNIQIPSTILNTAMPNSSITLYLSGGGFRGWGYMLMDSHNVSPYPIPLINGFRVPKETFLSSIVERSTVEHSMFRISSRRATQVPAIAFLITSLVSALPSLSTIHFAQGGLREGVLFSMLHASNQVQHPLVVATLQYQARWSTALREILESGIPPIYDNNPADPIFSTMPALVPSLTNLINVHASLPKDIRAAAALRSTTTGILSSAHGLSHEERAIIALALCERWGGEVSPTDSDFQSKLQDLVGRKASWWAKYIGCVAQGVGEYYPAGYAKDLIERLHYEAAWVSQGEDSHVKLRVLLRSSDTSFESWVSHLEKVGKKKNWIGGKTGWGLGVIVDVQKILP